MQVKRRLFSLVEPRKGGRDWVSAVSRWSCRVPGLCIFITTGWTGCVTQVLFESTGPPPGL